MLSLAIGFVLTACNTNKKELDTTDPVTEQKEQPAHDDKTEEHDHGYEMAMATYQCPMKCEGEKTYEEQGSCPQCKMDLKKVEVASTDETIKEEGIE